MTQTATSANPMLQQVALMIRASMTGDLSQFGQGWQIGYTEKEGLAGIQQRGTGVFLISEPVAANLHADKALCRERMRREGLHIRLQPTNKALVFLYLFRKVFQHP